jgi:hypothetical protein
LRFDNLGIFLIYTRKNLKIGTKQRDNRLILFVKVFFSFLFEVDKRGSAADIAKKAMVDVVKAILERKLTSQMILQLHDELLFEVAISEIPFFLVCFTPVLHPFLTLPSEYSPRDNVFYLHPQCSSSCESGGGLFLGLYDLLRGI